MPPPIVPAWLRQLGCGVGKVCKSQNWFQEEMELKKDMDRKIIRDLQAQGRSKCLMLEQQVCFKGV